MIINNCCYICHSFWNKTEENFTTSETSEIVNVNDRSDLMTGFNITSPLETLYLISINLFLILTFMQTLLSHEIVKISNLFILQLVI